MSRNNVPVPAGIAAQISSDYIEVPYGGYGPGYETLGALEDRVPGPGPTQYCDEVDYRTMRTLIPADAAPESLREPTVAEGVTFREKLRTDLTDY
jgi:hypothetical protein